MRLRLPLNRGTRNLNGTIYGGSIYAAVDPIHAVMLASLLGAGDYVAWTKEAHVRFLRQARTDLTARVVLTDAEVDAVRAEVERAGKVERRYTVELIDARKARLRRMRHHSCTSTRAGRERNRQTRPGSSRPLRRKFPLTHE